MGTTAEKGAYTLQTKSLLKQAINNIGGEVTDETTFRQYVNQLQNVYDNLPKTSFQEGTEITLSNTLKGKLDFDNGVVGIGQSSQDGTPTPSTPITINSVTGNQDVVVSGKNLVPFPYSSQAGLISGVNWSVNADGTINANGTADYTSSIFYLCNGDRDIYLDAGTYKISSNLFDDPHGFSVQAIQIVNGSYGTVYFNNMILTERTRLRIRILAKPNATVNVQNAYLMIEPGSTATPYEPYITPTSYQLSLGDIELNAIGNYKDELIYDVNEDKVYKKNVIGKYTFTGTEDWSFDSTTYNRIYIQSASILRPPCKIPSSNDDPPNILCNYLMNYNATTFLGDNSLNGITLSQNGTISARNTSKTTLEQYKSWLSEVKPVLYYVIGSQAQTLIEITDTTLINQVKALYNAHSNNGTTIITSNGNLPMIIKCRGLKGE